MPKKNKIIISIVGITIVALALLGITYAYYLTRIEGNTNTNSISVTTANLELVYGDGNGELTFANAIVPGDDIKFKDSNGNIVNSKTFTVTNNGEDVEYVVFVDNVNITKNGVSTTFESNDFRFTLTCVITSSDETRNNTSCNGTENSVLPLVSESTLVGNKILKGDVHNYVLTMEYMETGVDQSNDMGKSLSALIDIEDITRLNPYKDNTESLAYNIIENAKNNSNGAVLMATPLSKIGRETIKVIAVLDTEKELYEEFYGDDTSHYSTWSFILYGDTSENIVNNVDGCPGVFWEDENCTISKPMKQVCEGVIGKHIAYHDGIYPYIGKVLDCAEDGTPYLEKVNYNYEQDLVTTLDDYGTTYYYRGDVEDNYVNFAGMCWRIVRIEGDGSTKLLLEDQYTTCDDNETEITSAMYTGNWKIGDALYGYIYDETSWEHIIDYLNPENTGMALNFQIFQNSLAKKINTNLTDTSTQEELNTALASKLKIDDWCQSDFKSYNISLKCHGTKLTNFKDGAGMYVATLTADEISYAGALYTPNYGSYGSGVNNSSYIVNEYFRELKDDYFYSWLSLSINEFEGFGVGYRGQFRPVISPASGAIRPAITLKSGVEITGGNGTQLEPYEIG